MTIPENYAHGIDFLAILCYNYRWLPGVGAFWRRGQNKLFLEEVFFVEAFTGIRFVQNPATRMWAEWSTRKKSQNREQTRRVNGQPIAQDAAFSVSDPG